MLFVFFFTGIKQLLDSDESSNFDGNKYFELCRKTADIIETFVKEKVDDIPIAKKQSISQQDTAARIKLWKYLHCIDIIDVFLQLSQTSDARNEDNNDNSNSNNTQVDESKCRRNMRALEHKIDLDVEIYKYKKEHHWKLALDKQKQMENAFLQRHGLQKNDLVLDSFGASKKEAKEKQQFKVKERVEKQHKIMEFFSRK